MKEKNDEYIEDEDSEPTDEEIEEVETETRTRRQAVQQVTPVKKYVPTPPKKKEVWEFVSQPEVAGYKKGDEFLSNIQAIEKILNLLEDINQKL